jgi:hypothetical protein
MDRRSDFISENISPGDFKVVFEHGRLSVVGYRLSVVSCWLSVVGYQFSSLRGFTTDFILLHFSKSEAIRVILKDCFDFRRIQVFQIPDLKSRNDVILLNCLKS